MDELESKLRFFKIKNPYYTSNMKLVALIADFFKEENGQFENNDKLLQTQTENRNLL